MERQSGEGNEDKISELPEALLLKILSSLPTETVMATSVLSKRWKFLWKKIPNLKFDSKYHLHHIFSKNVFYALKLHKVPVLESLHLTAGHECDRLEMGKCIVVAFSRKVRKLVMKLELEDKDEVILFPPIVLKYSNTLEILKLKGPVVFFDLTSPVGLSSLRELHLYYVIFNDEESLSNLLSGCPKLQDLVVHLDSFVGVDTFTIAVPSLQRLTLAIDYFTENGGSYFINAPSLRRLYIKGFKNLDCCLIQNTPELVEAKITDVSDVRSENILDSLVSAKRLSFWLSPLKIKYPTGKIFYQLLYLELFVNEEDWWNLLSLMLVNSPKLQTLKLLNHFWFDKGPIGRKWNQPKCVPECLLFHLETFVWICYAWEREDEKEVATYIVKNARHLKKATFTTVKPIELEKVEERHEMLNQLGNEIRDRASDSCQVVFEFDSYGFLGREKDADLGEFVY